MNQRCVPKVAAMRIRSFCLTLLAATCSVSVAGSAQATSRQSQERAARKACLTGDYATGVSILSDLFLDSKDPIWIFNQGRCLEQNRRYEDAIARFEEFLRAGETTKLDKADRAAAQKHIADCRDLLAQQTARPPAAPAAASQPAAEAPTLPPSAPLPPAPQPAVAVSQANPAQPSSSHSGLRTAGIATASVGGAALVVGLILNLKVNAMASDMEKPAGYSDGKESDRKTYETLSWMSYGVGAACVTTGAVLYLLGRRSDEARPASVALLPLLSSDRTGVLLQGGF
jgi:hypothetical protein